MPKPSEWLASADVQLRAMVDRLTWHHHVRWNVPAYEFVPGDRSATEDLDQAEAFSSRIVPRGPFAPSSADDDLHEVIVDLDRPAWLVPSSTPEHHHLYVIPSAPIPWSDYVEWLDASAKIGLLEPGYVNACKERGMTSVRAPWVTKGSERCINAECDHRFHEDDPCQVDGCGCESSQGVPF